MTTGKQFRKKAVHCRFLARTMDPRTKASLETLAVSYDDGALLADLEAGKFERLHHP